ncbi:MAG: ATP-grasp domain-containing protein [Myxococcaceae bacterium]|nr:ATP-grasp domain-containing protein [Myxococcaceae bacterium]
MSPRSVGILGGGQLGLMLEEALLKLHTDVLVLEPDAESPAAARVKNVLAAPFEHASAVAELFRRCDVVTFDSENIPVGPLVPHAPKLVPSLRVLETTQDRMREKSFLNQHGFRTVGWQPVPEGADLVTSVTRFGTPCIIKSARFGYDGKGQYFLRTPDDAAPLPLAQPGGWVLEEPLQLRSELSCIVARDGQGGTFAFPVFENIHAQSVLDITLLPVRLEQKWQDEALQTAIAVADKLAVVGLLTVEFFVGTGRDGQEQLFINELAPRTHNSGHVTRQACSLSQFDALARILAQVPLHQPVLRPGAWAMGNLLGDVWLAQGRAGGALDLSAWRDFPDVVDVFLYGKREARPKRKMGHFVVHGDSSEKVLARSQAFRAALTARR